MEKEFENIKQKLKDYERLSVKLDNLEQKLQEKVGHLRLIEDGQDLFEETGRQITAEGLNSEIHNLEIEIGEINKKLADLDS